jgi:hypothetical protein
MTVDRRSVAALSVLFLLSPATPTSAQIVHARGQNVVPVYEGWERNPDGTFTMVFGYFNRNLEEEPFVAVGPENMFEPGDPDRGQPTHFYPRRQQFVFRVPIPGDWGSKELVWTIVANGRTEKAYGSLLPIYELGQVIYEQNRGGILLHGPGEPVNQSPAIALLGSARATLTLPAALDLKVSVADDGLPLRPPRRNRGSQPARRDQEPGPISQAIVRLEPDWRLGVTWMHYRGPGTVTFEPMRQEIPDGKNGQATTKVRFSEPGAYVIRAYGDDGVLTSFVDVTVTVKQ